MARTQLTGREVSDKSIFYLDIDLTTAPAHPAIVASDRFLLVDPVDGLIKYATYANLLTAIDTRYSLTSHTHAYLPLAGGTMSNTNLVNNLNADLLDGNQASAFALSAHSHNYQPLDADLTAIAALSGTSGYLKKTAADTWVLDTFGGATVLTDGIFDGTGLLYAPYAAQPTYLLTPASGVFYSTSAVANSKGYLGYTGVFNANSVTALSVYATYQVDTPNVSIGCKAMLDATEGGLYHTSGDQIIALCTIDTGYDIYHYANSAIQHDSYSVSTSITGKLKISDLAGAGDRTIGVRSDGQLIILAGGGGSLWSEAGGEITPLNSSNLVIVGGITANNGEFTSYGGAAISLQGHNIVNTAPSPLTNGMNAGSVLFNAYGATKYNQVAQILAIATAAHTTTIQPTRLDFYNTNAAGSMILSTRIEATGITRGMYGFGTAAYDGDGFQSDFLTGVSWDGANLTFNVTRIRFDGGLMVSRSGQADISFTVIK